MALSDKAQALLKQIYAYRGRGEEKFVDEDADEALEYVLQEIADTLADRHDHAAPLHMVIRDAVGGLNVDRRERREAQTSLRASPVP